MSYRYICDFHFFISLIVLSYIFQLLADPGLKFGNICEDTWTPIFTNKDANLPESIGVTGHRADQGRTTVALAADVSVCGLAKNEIIKNRYTA